MKKILIIFIYLALINQYGSAQFFDKYGVSIGASYSSLLWNDKYMITVNPNHGYKIGFLAFLTAEKRISKLFSFRREIGYIQKGFKNTKELTFSDGTNAGIDKENVLFHNLAANVGFKITPFDLKFPPYISLGFRGDYMCSYSDIVFEETISRKKYNLYKSQIDEFNKFNLGGLIGIGFEFSDLTFMEIEYNPSITSSRNDKRFQMKNSCWGLKVGINIQRIEGNCH